MGLEIKKCTGRHIKELCSPPYEKCHFTLKKTPNPEKHNPSFLPTVYNNKNLCFFPLIVSLYRPNTQPNVDLDTAVLFLFFFSMGAELGVQNSFFLPYFFPTLFLKSNFLFIIFI